MVPGAAWFGYRRLMAGWARRVSSCFTCYLGGMSGCWCVRPYGVFAPHPFLSACRGKEWRASFVPLGGAWAQEAAARRVVVCGGGVL